METGPYKLFYLKKQVIFPYCSLVVFVRPTDESKAIRKGDRVLAYTIRSTIDVIWYRDRIATLSEVTDVQADGKTIRIFLKGLSRVSLKRIIRFKRAECEPVAQQADGMDDAMRDGLRKKSQELVFLINVEESDRLITLLGYIVDPAQMTDFISNYFIMDFRTKYRLYCQTDMVKRGAMLTTDLDGLLRSMTRKRKKSG
jgi:ATP-dependent Lon protease